MPPRAGRRRCWRHPMSILAIDAGHHRRDGARRRRGRRGVIAPRATRSSRSTSPRRAGSSTSRRRSGRRPSPRPARPSTSSAGSDRPTARRHHQPARDRRALGPRDPAARRGARSSGRTGAPPASATRLRADGHEPRVAELTGLRLDPYFTGTKLTLARRRTSRTCGRGSRAGDVAVGTVDSYLVARLTRGPAPRHRRVQRVAHAAVRHPRGRAGPSELVRAVRGAARRRLPEVVPSYGVVGRTDPAAFLGLDLPIAGIAGDQQAALFGQACFAPGDEQVHLRHRLVRAGQHRRPTRCAPRRAAHHRRLAAPRRPAGPTPSRARSSSPAPRSSGCATGCSIIDSAERERGAGALGAGLRRRRLRAGADRSRRAGLGPARARHDPRHHARHHPRPPRARHPGGDRLRGAGRRRR